MQGFAKYMIACAVTAAAASAQGATLIAHYTFEDDPGGTTVSDLAPAQAGNNSGVLSNGASLVPVTGAPASAGAGLSGQALSLDGVDDFVDLTATSASILNGRSSFTYAAFINIASYPSGSSGENIFFVSHSGGPGGGRGVLQVQSSTGRVRAFARASTTESLTNVDEVAGDNTVPLNEWIHIAATYDIANNDIVIYKNGEIVANGQDQTFSAPSIENLDSLFVGIGANNNGGGEWLHGLIDDLRVYDGLLTQAEIQALALVPEPASLGLLGLGGLLALRRRR